MRFIIFVWAFMCVGLFLQLRNVVVLKFVFLMGKLGIFPCNEEGCMIHFHNSSVLFTLGPPHHVHMLFSIHSVAFSQGPFRSNM